MSEEINISPRAWMFILFLIGLLISISTVSYFYEKNEMKEFQVDRIGYLEGIVFNQTHEELNPLLNDRLTLKEAKRIYKSDKKYREILVLEINKICFK